jgi:hypothetical protein
VSVPQGYSKSAHGSLHYNAWVRSTSCDPLKCPHDLVRTSRFGNGTTPFDPNLPCLTRTPFATHLLSVFFFGVHTPTAYLWRYICTIFWLLGLQSLDTIIHNTQGTRRFILFLYVDFYNIIHTASITAHGGSIRWSKTHTPRLRLHIRLGRLCITWAFIC